LKLREVEKLPFFSYILKDMFRYMVICIP